MIHEKGIILSNKYMSLKHAVTLILREDLEIRVGMFFSFYLR